MSTVGSLSSRALHVEFTLIGDPRA